MISKIYRVIVHFEPEHGANTETIMKTIYETIFPYFDGDYEEFYGNPAAIPYVQCECSTRVRAEECNRLIKEVLQEEFNIENSST